MFVPLLPSYCAYVHVITKMGHRMPSPQTKALSALWLRSARPNGGCPPRPPPPPRRARARGAAACGTIAAGAWAPAESGRVGAGSLLPTGGPCPERASPWHDAPAPVHFGPKRGRGGAVSHAPREEGMRAPLGTTYAEEARDACGLSARRPGRARWAAGLSAALGARRSSGRQPRPSRHSRTGWQGGASCERRGPRRARAGGAAGGE
jgi:hypothetical protein